MAGLSIIAPTWNPHYIFHEAIKDIALNHSDWQIVIIDDHSEIAVSQYLPDLPNLEIYRNSANLGAGACRNIGIQKISQEYTLFLDDDDQMHWDVVQSIMTRMEADASIDVSLCLYDMLLNGARKGAWGNDRIILSEALQGNQERITTIAGNEMLLAFTNYPWNKLYRSSFLKRANLRFSETPVQNDIFAHWATLLRANRILLSDVVICTKVEYGRAERIGNISDSRSVTAFQAFREAYDLVRFEGSKRAAEVFLHFYLNMVRWLMSKSSPEIRQTIFQEHTSLFDFMRSEGFLNFAETDIRRWEIWDLSIMNENAEKNQYSSSRGFEVTDYSIVLAEMSRLKHLVVELQADNEAIRTESVAMRSAIETKQSEYDAIKTENDAIKTENDAIKTENDAIKTENDAIKTENEAIKAENRSLQDINEALQVSNNHLLKLSSRKIVRMAVFVVDALSLKICAKWRHDGPSHN